MENSNDKVIVKVLPYNKKHDNTKKLKDFKNFLDSFVKKNEYDQRERNVFGISGQKLPKESIILFLYDKKIYGYGVLDNIEENPKINDADKIIIKYLPNTVKLLEVGIPLSEIMKLGYVHSKQSGSAIECEKREIYKILNKDYSNNIDTMINSNDILEDFSKWNINSLFPSSGYSNAPIIGKKTKKAGTDKTGIAKCRKGRIAELKVISFLESKGFKLYENILDDANDEDIFWDITFKVGELKEGLEVKNLTNSGYFYLSQNQMECLKKQETKLCLIDVQGKCIWISKNFTKSKILPKIISYVEKIKNDVYIEYSGLFQVDDIRININTEIDNWNDDFVRIDSRYSKDDIIKIIFD